MEWYIALFWSYIMPYQESKCSQNEVPQKSTAKSVDKTGNNGLSSPLVEHHSFLGMLKKQHDHLKHHVFVLASLGPDASKGGISG